MDKIKILIAAHKDCDIRLTNPVYTVVCGEGNNINTTLDTVIENKGKWVKLNHSWNELSRYGYWIDTNKKNLPEYLGTAHYRRSWVFSDAIPNPDLTFEEYDAILPQPVFLAMTVREQYRQCHDYRDFDEAMQIIRELHPEYAGDIDAVSNKTELYAWNMTIMPTDRYLEYFKFVTDVIKEYHKRHDFKTDGDISKVKNDYQSRVGGFLAERIGNVWFNHNVKKPLIINVEMV